MKLIGDNAGRRPIAFQSPSQGVDAKQNVNTQTPIVLDNQGGVVLAGSTAFNDGNGIFLGWCNGVPVFSLGSDSGGLAWDGDTLDVVGNVVLGIGNSISGGATAFGGIPGFWLGTDASGNPQFSLYDSVGDYIRFDGSTPGNVIGIYSPTGLIGILTSLQVDDAGLGTTASWGTVGQQPGNIAGYNLTGIVQPSLPAAIGTQILQQTNGGSPAWVDQFGLNQNGAGFDVGGTSTNLTSSFQQIGGTVIAPNPGSAVTILATASGYFSAAGTVSVAPQYQIRLSISTDSGSTWTAGNLTNADDLSLSANSNIPFGLSFALNNVTPTGDIWIKLECKLFTGTTTVSFNVSNAWVNCQVLPTSSVILLSGALVVTVPPTRSASCTANYPATTCAALQTIRATRSGGLPAYTDSWSISAHTGTGGSIVGGSTTPNVSVSDTETATTGGAAFTTTYKDTVTDAQTYATTAGTRAAGTATLTIGAHSIPAGATVTVSGCTPTAYNGTFVVTGVTATQIQYALSGTTAVTVNGTVNNVNVTSSGCVVTSTFTLIYPTVNVSIAVNPGLCFAAAGVNCTAFTSATASVTGGDGTVSSHSWTRTSGAITLVSGTTTATVQLSQTDTTPTTDSSVIKCVATDGHSNAGNNSATVKMNFKVQPT